MARAPGPVRHLVLTPGGSTVRITIVAVNHVGDGALSASAEVLVP